MNNIRRISFILVALLFQGMVSLSASQLEWRLADGGNGHVYEFVEANGITWTEARLAAENLSFMGAPGHLATITSQEEWDFVLNHFAMDFTWIGLTDEAQENDFQWVTGETFSFAAWGVNPQEPNNAGNEDYVYMERRSSGWGWNDFRDVESVFGSPLNYLVEYSVVIPEPSTFLLVLLGLSGLLFRFWKKG